VLLSVVGLINLALAAMQRRGGREAGVLGAGT